MRKLSYILTFMAVFFSVQLEAQITYAYKSLKAYQMERLPEAMAYSDTAISIEDEAEDPQTWNIRGFIYASAAKTKSAEERIQLEDESIKALLKTIKMDSAKIYTERALSKLYKMSVYYNNLTVNQMNDKDYRLTKKSYSRFRTIAQLAQKKIDWERKDLEFYGAYGSLIHGMYNNNKKDHYALRDEAKGVFAKMLELDSTNISANYNYGVIYYNLGVDELKSMPDSASLDMIFSVQNKTTEYFKKSRPFMLRAHQLDPTNAQTLNALEGIDYELNRPEDVKIWRTKQEVLKSQDK